MRRVVRNPMLSLAVLAFAVLGALAGTCLGYLILLQRTKLIADQFVIRLQTIVEAAIREEYRDLKQLDNSPYPACSSADLDWMRMLVFHSSYLNEIGRLRGERPLCTATRGRLPANSPVLPAAVTLASGVQIFLNVAPYQKEGTNYVGVRKGNSFVIFRPTIETFFSSAPLQYAITVRDGRQSGLIRTAGTLHQVPDWILSTPGRLYWNGSVYATRCGARSIACVTASLPLTTAFSYASSGLILTTLVGALVGGLGPLLGFFLSRGGYLMAWQLRQAIRANKLRVVYMPVVLLSTRAVVGAEALVRWDDDEGRPISPELFVRLAEQRGFVGELTRLVVRRVMQDMGAYMRLYPGFRLSINATATDFADREFVPMLCEVLHEAQVAPESLIVEITESSTARQKVVCDTIKALRARGIHVHIDDFGTGYSSLAYLHELSVDAIKIDKSFTQAIGTEAVAGSILPQVVAMADALSLEVIVEGIETEQQASYFLDLDKPRLGQGWLFGAPVPAETFFDLYQFGRLHLGLGKHSASALSGAGQKMDV